MQASEPCSARLRGGGARENFLNLHGGRIDVGTHQNPTQPPLPLMAGGRRNPSVFLVSLLASRPCQLVARFTRCQFCLSDRQNCERIPDLQLRPSISFSFHFFSPWPFSPLLHLEGKSLSHWHVGNLRGKPSHLVRPLHTCTTCMCVPTERGRSCLYTPPL